MVAPVVAPPGAFSLEDHALQVGMALCEKRTVSKSSIASDRASTACSKTRTCSTSSAASDQASVGCSSERTVSAVFVKTRKCRFFGMGICTKGDACTYAHALKELRPMPDFSRTKICPSVSRGESCSNPRCKFAHKQDEKRKLTAPICHKDNAMMSNDTGMMSDIEDDSTKLDRGCDTNLPCFTQAAKESSMEIETLTVQSDLPKTLAAEIRLDKGQGDVNRRMRTRGCRAGRKRAAAKSVREMATTESSIAEEKPSQKVSYDSLTVSHRPLAESRLTSICPVLIAQGECKKSDCTYAHSIEDLRKNYALSLRLDPVGSAITPEFAFTYMPSVEAEELNDQDASDCEEMLPTKFNRLVSSDEPEMIASTFNRLVSSDEPEPLGIFDRSISQDGINPPGLFDRLISQDSACSKSIFSRLVSPMEELSMDNDIPAMLVHKTFLTFEPLQRPLEQRLRRVHSAPCRFDNQAEHEQSQFNRQVSGTYLYNPGALEADSGEDRDYEDDTSASLLAGTRGAQMHRKLPDQGWSRLVSW